MATCRLSPFVWTKLFFPSRTRLIPPASRDAGFAKLTRRPLSISSHTAWPHSSTPTSKSQAAPLKNQEEGAPRPFSEIPKTKTVLGLNLEVMKDPFRITDYAEKTVHELGHIFRITGTPGIPSMVFVVDPKEIEKVYRLGDQDYPKRFPFDMWKKVREDLKIPFGIFLEEGEAWHNQRMPISKFIMMPRKMAEYHQPFNNVAADVVNLIRNQRREDNLFSDVVLLLNKWSLESVSFFVLGKRLGCLEDQMPPECKKYVDSIHIFLEMTTKLMFSLPFHKIWPTKNWKTLVNSFDYLYSYASGHVNEKIAELEKAEKLNEFEKVDAELGMDFLTYMIHSGNMSVEELAVNAVDLISAGVDTSSLTVSACLYCIANNPDVQDKLREEVQRVVGNDEMVTPQHIQEMHYLRDCVKEAQRMYPIAPNNARILKEDVVLSGYHIPAGTVINLPVAVPGRLPEFFPEPQKFRPERWSKDSKEIQNSFISQPFGFGRRSCVGRRVAELEMHVLLAQLIKNFKIEYREYKPIEFIIKLFNRPERQVDLAFIDV